MIGAIRKLNGTYWPVPIAMVAIAVVMLFLFAFPLVSGWMGFALPFLTLGLFVSMFVGMNARWKLWHGSRPVMFSIADLGFLLCLAAFALYSFAYISDTWTNLPYVLIGFVIVLVFRVAFIEFEAWWLGILLAGMLALVFDAYALFTLPQPSWFFDFSASLLLLAGTVLLLAGSVACVIKPPGSSSSERWPGWLKAGMAGLGLVLTAALVTSALLTRDNRETVAASGAAGLPRIVFEAGRIEESTRLPALPAGPSRLLFVNQDLRVHTFTIEELDIDVHIGPRSERLIVLDLPAGEYRFECRVPGHSERGRIEVE